ncbi:MAG: CapA family protein [Betaproteobacteria bacterium]|nr:MAG: CapA family protein [Betaproteobacteria bacterium]
MATTVMLTGDVNLMGVEDPAVPFRSVRRTFEKADVVFCNLECCLYEPPLPRTMMADEVSGYEGFYAPPASGQALKLGGFHCVGNANNQNYGPEQIVASNACLDELGIPHVGTGIDRKAARAPAVVTRNGKRVGFLQRTSQYWPNNHEALDARAGVAVIKAYTAYQPVYYKDGTLPPNRPGTPPIILTWCDRDYLDQFKQDVSALKAQCDIVVSSHHMGHRGDILDFQVEIAHAAIDSGADVVMAHAEHYPLGIEVYKGKPIYYGLGSFCFFKSNKRYLRGWVGLLARVTFEGDRAHRMGFSFVRQQDDTEVVIRNPEDETAALEEIRQMSARFKTELSVCGDEVLFSAAR